MGHTILMCTVYIHTQYDAYAAHIHEQPTTYTGPRT